MSAPVELAFYTYEPIRCYVYFVDGVMVNNCEVKIMLKPLKVRVTVLIVMLGQIAITHASPEQSSAFSYTSSHSLSGQVKQCANEILEVYWLKKYEFCDTLSKVDI